MHTYNLVTALGRPRLIYEDNRAIRQLHLFWHFLNRFRDLGNDQWVPTVRITVEIECSRKHPKGPYFSMFKFKSCVDRAELNCIPSLMARRRAATTPNTEKAEWLSQQSQLGKQQDGRRTSTLDLMSPVHVSEEPVLYTKLTRCRSSNSLQQRWNRLHFALLAPFPGSVIRPITPISR